MARLVEYADIVKINAFTGSGLVSSGSNSIILVLYVGDILSARNCAKLLTEKNKIKVTTLI